MTPEQEQAVFKAFDTEPTKPLDEMTQGELLDEYRRLLDMSDRLGSVDRKISKAKAAAKERIIDLAAEQDVDAMVGRGISVRIKEKVVVRISGDWNEIFKSFVDAGLGFLVQKRITATKLQDEFDAGLRLPDGVQLDEIVEVAHTRRAME